MIRTKLNLDKDNTTIKTFAQWVKAVTEGRDYILSPELERVLNTIKSEVICIEV